MQPATLIDLSISPSQDVMQRLAVELRVKNASQIEVDLPVVSFAVPVSSAPELVSAQNEDRKKGSLADKLVSALFLAANDIFSPLSIRENGKFVHPGMSFVLCVGLSAFFVWSAYFAVPTLPQTIPLTSLRGAGYMALLIPSALMASCLALSAGRLIGKWSGKAFSAVFNRRGAARKPTSENLPASENPA